MFILEGIPRFSLFAESVELTLLNWFHLDLFDLLFVVIAIVFNIQIMGIYFASKQKHYDMVRKFGMVTISLALPLAIVAINNLILGRERWIMIGFLFIFLYLAVELIFDFIYKIDFRSSPTFHIPYIVLFYIVEFSFIAIAFSMNTVSGYLVSLSFWALLICLVYSLWPINTNVLRRGE
jgi:hypothetical protein